MTDLLGGLHGEDPPITSLLSARWQRALGRTVPDAPTTTAMDDRARVAHCRVLLEETLELIEALGCTVHATGSREAVTGNGLTVEDDPRRDGGSLEDIAHEHTDLSFILATIGVMYGLPVEDLFRAMFNSNMTKILPDGTLLRHQKKDPHAQYRPPAIRSVLRANGADI